MFFEALFTDAPEGLLVEVAYGDPPTNRKWIRVQSLLDSGLPDGPAGHTFFGPAARSRRGSGKDDTHGTRCLWVDRDDPEFHRATLPPSFVVWSGHGWHYYWLLTEWVTDRDAIELANRILIEDVDGDRACWNVNRLLRVPGTDNSGAKAELRHSNLAARYDLGDLQTLESLDSKTRHKIRTGDSRGYPSRSERDWAVVSALLAAGAGEEVIETIFKHQPVGEKVNDPETHSSYLGRTIKRASTSPLVLSAKGGFEERGDGYYVHKGKSIRRVSTFTFDPKLLLDGRAYNSPDALVGTVRTERSSWEDVTFTRAAFSGVRRLDKETPYMGWQWLGRDDDVRNLLPYLVDILKDKGFPRTEATGVLGLHESGGRSLFVGTEGTISSDSYWSGTSGPLVYLDTRREHPSLHLEPPSEDTGLQKSVASLVPKLNEPETIWPIIGWYFGTPFKPALEAAGYRFPILNVYGTKGSGKTTTIQRVMMPLLGQTDPRSYDANTTRFVILSLLGSSNAVPVAFSEFRFGSADKFLRYVLLAYDTGHDPRGRADQTTVDYPLSAPFSVDGEDLIADPAAKERILAVQMHPAAVAEGTEYYDVRASLTGLDLSGFASGYIQAALRLLLDGDFASDLTLGREAVLQAFPSRLPDRVRQNLVVTYFGVRRFCTYTGIATPDASVLSASLEGVFSVDAGRAPVAADFMVEDLVNSASRAEQRFTWGYNPSSNTFLFQFSSAYNWWSEHRRDSLGRDSIRGQLKEIDYVGDPEKKERFMMWPVDLDKAREAGLDIPDKLNPGVLEVRF